MAMAYALIGSLVEAIFPQDRTKAYQPATVLSQDEDGYELVLYDVRAEQQQPLDATCSRAASKTSFAMQGFETTCSAEDVRPYPLEADTQLLALVPGLPVDLHDPKTGRWRTMCSLQSADMPLREGMEILLLDPGEPTHAAASHAQTCSCSAGTSTCRVPHNTPEGTDVALVFPPVPLQAT
jgi:hypothetical protein